MPDAIDAVFAFVECINRGDADGMGRLMSDDHELRVFAEPPVRGRDANVVAWRAYADNFPRYAIHPDVVVECDGRVAVLGATTGSHLGLPDKKERQITLIWVADVDHGVLRTWQLVDDTPEQRLALGLGTADEPRR